MEVFSLEESMARKSADKAKAKASENDSAEPTPAPEPQAAPAPESEAEPTPAAEPTDESVPETPAPSQQDSLTFSRCAGCANAKEIDRSAGTLVCSQYNMLVNAEADEIPDDCIEYRPSEGAAPEPTETPSAESPTAEIAAPESPQ